MAGLITPSKTKSCGTCELGDVVGERGLGAAGGGDGPHGEAAERAHQQDDREEVGALRSEGRPEPVPGVGQRPPLIRSRRVRSVVAQVVQRGARRAQPAHAVDAAPGGVAAEQR